jgi:hypothetical protein
MYALKTKNTLVTIMENELPNEMISKRKEVKRILAENYGFNKNRTSEEQNLSDIETFIALFKADRKGISAETKLFSQTAFLRSGDDGKEYRSPEQVFIDLPFENTGLASVGDVLQEKKIWTGYFTAVSDHVAFLLFIKFVGVMAQLKTVERKFRCKTRGTNYDYGEGRTYMLPKEMERENNSSYFDEELYKVTTERETTCINIDYQIYALPAMLKKRTLEASLLIWKTMPLILDWKPSFGVKDWESRKRNKLIATYRPNKKWKGETEFPSWIKKDLTSAAWIPNNDLEFFEPSDISQEDVHKSFEIPKHDDDSFPSWNWYNDIGLRSKKVREEKEFQIAENANRERRILREQAAKELGFSIEEVELFSKYKAFLDKRIGKVIDLFDTE